MEKNLKKQKNDSQIVKLLSHPFIAAIDVQSKMIDKYLETIERLAFGNGSEGDSGASRKTKTLNFSVDQLIRRQEGGGVIREKQKMEVPLISLVKIPALTMKEIKINLILGVNPNDPEVGDVRLSTRKSRSTDVTPKYTIDMHADREEPAPGMYKLLEVMADSIVLD